MTASDYLVLLYFVVLVVSMLILLARGGFWWKPLLILFVLSTCSLMLWYPGRYGPNQRLKPGLDLAGGTTLIYDVQVPPEADALSVIDDTIAVLKERVDPTGTRNLIWRQLAGNRLEIQMALASPETKRRRIEMQAAREQLLVVRLSESALDAAVRVDRSVRTQTLRDLAGSEAQAVRLNDLAKLFDNWVMATEPYRQAERAFREVQDSGADAAVTAQLLTDLQAKTIAYVNTGREFKAAMKSVLAANISEPDLEVLQKRDNRKTDDSGRTARQRAVVELIAKHPDRQIEIERFAETWNQYDQVKGALDDPHDLIALLQGSGVLEFRIAAQPGELDTASYQQALQEKGPRGAKKDLWRWFEIQDINRIIDTESERAKMREDPTAYFETSRGLAGAEYGGRYFVLLGNTPRNAITRADEGWELSNVGAADDEMGGLAVAFSLNAIGGQFMRQLTSPHVGQPMAILLDGKTMNIATIQEALSTGVRITGGTGGFSESELRYLTRTLRAGSLDSELGEFPISIKTTGPQLGEDNLRSGLNASIAALILVAAAILFYYLLAGAVADFALLANMVIILGIMSMIEATWTLPGIAGIVLTIGMAVDANVLIFERIREELERKSDLKTAVRVGYEKAFSTILDANLTTLIVCLVLGYTASAEVKGFAVVLGIGILATLFSSLFCSRVIIEFFMDKVGIKNLNMLPMQIGAIGRLLSPRVNWIGKRHIFLGLSAILVIAGALSIYTRGKNMLDIEFRAGTAVSFNLREDATLPIQQVRQRLEAFGQLGKQMQQSDFDPDMLTPNTRLVHEKLAPIVAEAQRRYEDDLADYETDLAEKRVLGARPEPVDFSLLGEGQVDVVTEGESVRGVASAFRISTLITDSQAVSAVVKSAFDDVLDTTRPIDFAARQVDRIDAAPVYRIKNKSLGENIARLLHSDDVTDYLGGVAIVVDAMTPSTTVADLKQRIKRIRMQPAYEDLGMRRFKVIGLDPAPEVGDGGQTLYHSAAVIVSDTTTNYLEDPEAFDEIGGLAQTEWRLVVDALRRDTSLASVNNFSPAVSGTMTEDAIAALSLSLLAVIAYIWFRFGSFHYGLAAILALMHDVVITLGLVAVCGWLFQFAWAEVLLLEPFKINLPMVAALLTIVGYSLNDTIVIFDRIRENRGRMARATPGIINDSINQTISRTVLTSGTTLLALLTLYISGGSGVHGFAFAMLIGVLVGTYSSVAIAAPLLLLFGRNWTETSDIPQSGRDYDSRTAAMAAK